MSRFDDFKKNRDDTDFNEFRKEVEKEQKGFFSGDNLIIGILLVVGLIIYTVYFMPESNLMAQDNLADILRDNTTLKVFFLNVGQGDATFIATPDNRFILIDGGEGEFKDNKYSRQYNAGKEVVIPFLKRMGITKLDIVIATHPHSDHIGGLIDVLKAVDADVLYDCGQKSTSRSYKYLLGVLKRKNIKYKIPKPGDRLDFGSEVYAQVMAPMHLSNNTNNNSVVVLVKKGIRKFLLVGDAEKESEFAMIRKWGRQLKCDVLKAGHHGSKTSSSIGFLKIVKPKYTIFSAGAHNNFGHPAKEILKRVQKYGSKIYRTDLHGTIIFTTDGKNLDVKTEAQ